MKDEGGKRKEEGGRMKEVCALESALKVVGCTFSHREIPPTPLKKGGTRLKVPLFKGDLGGSRSFCYQQSDFSNILLIYLLI